MTFNIDWDLNVQIERAIVQEEARCAIYDKAKFRQERMQEEADKRNESFKEGFKLIEGEE